MPRTTFTLEIDPEYEDLLRRQATFLGDMKDLAETTPDGSVLDACESAVIEKGWRDLKIAVAQKRPPAGPATAAEWESREFPAATARVMWADIASSGRFRRSWWARPRRLGVPAMSRVHVLGDGASWIRKAAGRALTGC